MLYYRLKQFMPRSVQLFLRRWWVHYNLKRHRDEWPILDSAGSAPEGWTGWPEGKQFAVVLTHDVEHQKGHDRCLELMELERSQGFKSLFNFVPERYNVSDDVRKKLVENGFEVGVHGLKHDGKLFQSRKIFNDRANKINYYLKEWNAVGFRSPAMHRNLEWISDLNISYDLSTFDTDPFEPQPDGVETIFPFWVNNGDGSKGYVEMPYTLAQDFTPLILMKCRDIEFWTKKVDWIAQKGGMVLVNTHPDYMCFSGKPGNEEFPVEYYLSLLRYIEFKYHDQYWHVLPKELADFFRNKKDSV